MKILAAVLMTVVVFLCAGIVFAESAGDSDNPMSFFEGKININTAGIDEFAKLPAIDRLEAKRIVDYRTENGPFNSPDDLLKIWGVRRLEFNRVEPFLATSGETTLKLKDMSLYEGKVNINTAGVDEFIMLPAIDRFEAQNIIDYRTANGPFKALDDLLKVKGVRRLEYNRMKDYLTLGKRVIVVLKDGTAVEIEPAKK